MRWVRRLLALAVAILALTTVAVVAVSATMQERHLDGRSLVAPVEAAIVLGGGIEPDGVLSYSSRRRTAAAVGLLREGRADRLIFSGGAVPVLDTSVAALMRDHALDLGAPPDALFVENRARTTFENLRFAFGMAERAGLDRLALVTDSYHLGRAAALARYFGRPGIGLVAARGLEWERWHERAFHTGREALAWWYNAGKVAGWSLLDTLGIGEGRRAGLVW